MSAPEKDVNHAQRVERVGTAASVRSSENDLSDSKDNAADVAAGEHLASQWVEGTAEEKKLVRKLDWRILPCTWVLYLLGFLDRANIGYVSLPLSTSSRVVTDLPPK